MRKSTRRDGKVRDYTVVRLRGFTTPTYRVEVEGSIVGFAVKEEKGQIWAAHTTKGRGALILEGFASRTHAAEAVLKINGFEMI